ncbi:MAG: DUF2795 domain-containing protein [Thaumarchaeota archaeon]|nr:MAG: DUF2795 domain-containing protein [Nitrososphaerota archaeon]
MARSHRSRRSKKTKSQTEEKSIKGKLLEHGDIFFFYRPKVRTEEVRDIENVQRFYMVTSPDNSDVHRIFLVGQKRLPEIVEGKSSSEERNWALNVLTSSNPHEIRKEFLPAEYQTETRGTRRIGAAVPAGEGKYSIVEHEGHSELAYILELPEEPGPTQREFQIKKEASYIVSVKNPDIQVPGYNAFLKRKPHYPNSLKEKFGNRRWINVEDPHLLDYENAQLLLIGARKKDVEEELGIDIDEEKETSRTAELFNDLKIKKEQVPLKPLFTGKFPSKKDIPFAQEIKRLSIEEAPGRGGKVGGKIAASSSASAASVAKVLSGIKFPKNKDQLIHYAEQNKYKVSKPDVVIEALKELHATHFENMSDVEKALGAIR